jgi:quinol monooxygenase YgiN
MEDAPARQSAKIMIQVIAIITTRRGQRDPVLQLLRANMPKASAAKGCLAYDAGVDSVPTLNFQTELGPNTFVVTERWETLEAFEAHSTAPHMISYLAKTRDMIANRVIHVLSLI